MDIQNSTEKGAEIEASSLFAAFGEKLYNTAFQMCRSDCLNFINNEVITCSIIFAAMDRFDFSTGGIKHRYLPDFLLALN